MDVGSRSTSTPNMPTILESIEGKLKDQRKETVVGRIGGVKFIEKDDVKKGCGKKHDEKEEGDL
jgi:hypothetical protein